MKVLLTEATGTLGRRLVSALSALGYDVRALSRRAQTGDDVAWFRGDLRTGDGIEVAVAGAETIVHAATLGGFAGGKARARYLLVHPSRTDVAGTQRLVDAARAASVTHIVYVSIVGVDRVRMSYDKHKLAAEEIVAVSGVPYTIVRASQFHALLDAMLRYLTRFPVAFVAREMLVQPIDTFDAAAAIVRLAGGSGC
ncbi:MAG: NAD-dependent epimerase/dehydratase family protein, partial [Actinobacteria bacterium]